MAFNKSPIDVSNLCEIVISKQLKGGLLDSIVMLILRGLADYEIDLQVQSKKGSFSYSWVAEIFYL